jgi:hypothetical protein
MKQEKKLVFSRWILFLAKLWRHDAGGQVMPESVASAKLTPVVEEAGSLAHS